MDKIKVAKLIVYLECKMQQCQTRLEGANNKFFATRLGKIKNELVLNTLEEMKELTDLIDIVREYYNSLD